MRKVTILALHLGYGGVEKAIVNLANCLSNKYDVEIISVYRLYDEPAFDLNDSVKVKYLIKEKPNKLELKKAVRSLNPFKILRETFFSIKVLYKRQKHMKKAIKDCSSDIIVSSRILFNNWLKKSHKVSIIRIGWEHNHHNNNKKYIKKLVNSCKNLDYLVNVSEELNNFYSNKLKDLKCKSVFIPNIVEKNGKESNLKGKNIISIGRLENEKGFLDLIDIFHGVLKTNPDWKLNLVGDGKQRNLIEEKVRSYGIEKSVNILGYRDEKYINNLLNSQSIYVMTSYTESFGIVLIEAMNKGIPCIAFNSAQGAKEIIKNNTNGYLIKNRNKKLMEEKINYLINNYSERVRLGSNAINVGQKYEPNVIFNKWDKIIKKRDNRDIKVLFISSTGGHLSELLQLESMFDEYNYHIITEKTKSTLSLKNKYGKRIDYLVYGTKSRFLSYMYKFPYNCIKSLFLYIKIKPKVIVTTGAHTAVPMCYIGKLFGTKIIFIETLANIETRTLSGRMVYPIANIFIVQWENMLKFYPKSILGGKMY